LSNTGRLRQTGRRERVKTLEAEIDSFLREKEEIEKWAAVGSG
jgi:hypothetical protein